MNLQKHEKNFHDNRNFNRVAVLLAEKTLTEVNILCMLNDVAVAIDGILLYG